MAYIKSGDKTILGSIVNIDKSTQHSNIKHAHFNQELLIIILLIMFLIMTFVSIVT